MAFSFMSHSFSRRAGSGSFFSLLVIGIWAACSLFAGGKVAASPAPLTLTRIPISSGNTPFAASAVNLAAKGYIEEEYLVDGTANIYEYDANKEVQVQTPNVAYQTRIMIRRPISTRKFNGTVIFEWMNPTAGFDIDFLWHFTNRKILEDGYIWVGITVRPNAIGFMQALYPARYASMHMADAGQIYDAVSRLGVLLRDRHASQNPLAAFNVRQMIGTGYSQTAIYLVTYINEFHKDATLSDGSPAFTGYLVGSAFGRARQINSTSSDYFDERRFITPPVPVMRTQTETEVEGGSATARVPDSDLYRTYEWAGTSHADTEILQLTQEVIERDIPGAPAPECINTINPIAQSPFLRSALVNLNLWIRFGIKPPPAVLINLDDEGAVIRDEHNNATASQRPPGLEAPLGTHLPFNDGTGPCFLSGSFFPFDEAKLDALYPTHGRYVSKVTHAASRLALERYLLLEDAWQYVTDAAHSSVGK